MNKQDKLNEKIVALSDDEIIQGIKDTNADQLSNIGTMAYIELFNRNIYLRSILSENKELVEKVLAEEPKFKEIYIKVDEKVLDISSVLDIEKLDEELDLEELRLFRADIVKILKTLTAYSTEISYTHEIAKDILYKEFIKDNKDEIDKIVDQQKFFDAVSKFVMEDPLTSKNRIMDITNVLPMRITRDKYYDIISQAFKTNLNYSSKRQVDVVLSRYKTLINGTLEAEYGLYFNNYFMKAQEARQADFKKLSYDELNEIYEDSYKTVVEIGNISNIIREFGIIVNRLISIYILKDEILKNIKQYDVKSLQESWKDYFEDGDSENQAKVLKIYKKIFEKLDLEFKDTNTRLQALTRENFNRKNKVNDDLKSELMKTQYILEYINDYAVDQEEILEEDYQTIAEKVYLDQAVDNLVEFIDRNINEMDMLQRRIRMKRLLTLTENAFVEPNKFFEYVANSIERISSKEELIATVNGVLEIITEYRSRSSFGDK